MAPVEKPLDSVSVRWVSLARLAEPLFESCDMQGIDCIYTVGFSDHNHDAVADCDKSGTWHVQLSAIGQANGEWLKTITDSVLDPLNIHDAIEAACRRRVKECR